MHAHRVDIFDGTDDDTIVGLVTDNLHLIFFPTEQRFFDQHFSRRRCIKSASDDLDEFIAVIGNPAARAAHCEARADNGRQASALKHFKRLIH